MNIGIIVDHPNRDLPSLCLLSEKLIEKNSRNSIILIPMYKISWVLNYFPNKFDIIIFNFAREANQKYIIRAHNYGIKTIVYDQEGVGGKKGLGLLNILSKSRNVLPFIDLYCFWGKNQLEKFEKSIEKKSHPKKKIVSGWLNSDYLFKLKKKFKNKKKYILINSNFPGCDPKFNSLSNEIKSRLKTFDISKKELLNRIYYQSKRKKNFLHAVKILIKSFPKKNFLLRPHPYENDKKYTILQKQYKNCKVSNKYSINQILLNTEIFLHVDCTTAISSSFLNIPTLSLDWIIQNKESEVFNEIANSSGIKTKNIFELKNLITEILKNNKNINLRNNKLSDYYGKFDGERCNNLANEINKQFNFTKKNLHIKNFTFKENVKFFIFELLGQNKYSILRKFLMNKEFYSKQKKDKNFSIIDVKNYITNKNLKIYKINFNCIVLKA